MTDMIPMRRCHILACLLNQRTFLYPHIAVALRARELYSTIIDIHHLEIKTQCLKLMA